MNEFNRLTTVAAVEVIEAFHSHDDMKVLEVQWDIQQYLGAPRSKSGRVAEWAKVVAEINPMVWTEEGQMNLERALVERAIKAPNNHYKSNSWEKLVAGLRFDGFEVYEIEAEIDAAEFFDFGGSRTSFSLVRMLPSDVPDLDFRETESEIEGLLRKHQLTVALGHLVQAKASFQRGEWASANAQLRSFFESYLNEITKNLGYSGEDKAVKKLRFLGEIEPPFLMPSYNEPEFVQGLWKRMHPEGSHPGLSEEEDAAFRLQITLVTARLFLRRFDQRRKVS